MSEYSSAEDEYDEYEPPKLDLNLDKLMTRATKVLGAKCTCARPLTRGASHEIFVLQFEAPDSDQVNFDSLITSNYTCIARLARVKGKFAKEESEIATIKYLKKHSAIPVAEIYHYDLSPDNDIGASFVLMQRLPGRHLYKSWDGLSLNHKKLVLSQIASLVAQFAALSFDKIGCLTDQGMGPIISPCLEPPQGPFRSTLNYLRAFVPTNSVESPELKDLFGQIQTELATYMQNESSGLDPPFTLIHADFDAQNMLFSEAPDGSGPVLTGLIDFELSHTGPIYFLYEHPIFIQDIHWSKELYEENAILRAHFVKQIFLNLPTPEAQKVFIACMNAKSFILNDFHRCFMWVKSDEKMLNNLAYFYLKQLKDGDGKAYCGREDYRPEYYSQTGEPVGDKAAGISSPLADQLSKKLSLE